MNLTAEQEATIVAGDAVRVVIGKIDCVLLRTDVYAQLCGDLDPRETYEAMLRVWDAEGSPQDGELYP